MPRRDYTAAMIRQGRRWQDRPAPRAQARDRLAGLLGLSGAELAGARVAGGTLAERLSEARTGAERGAW